MYSEYNIFTLSSQGKRRKGAYIFTKFIYTKKTMVNSNTINYIKSLVNTRGAYEFYISDTQYILSLKKSRKSVFFS